MRKLIRVLLVFFGVLLVLVVTAYIFRAELTRFVAGHVLKQHGAQVTCAQWDLNPIAGNVHAQKLCLSYQGHETQLSDVTLGFERISIAQANIRLGPLPQSDTKATTAQPLDLPLPLVRPRISIDNLTVEGEPLPTPLTLQINEVALNQFQLQGDVDGSLGLKSDEVTFSLALQSKLTATLNQWLDTHIEPQSQWQMYFEGIHLDGFYQGNALALTVRQQGQLSGVLVSECSLDARLSGSSLVQSVDMQQFTLDASELDVQISHQAMCAEMEMLTPHIEPVLSTPWQLNLPKSIMVSAERLESANLVLTNQGERHKAAVQLSDLSATFAPFALQSDYKSQIELPSLGTLSLEGVVSTDSIAGLYKGNLQGNIPNELSADKVGVQGDFDYTFKGNGSTTAQFTTSEVLFAQNRLQGIALELQAYIQNNNIFESEWQLGVEKVVSPVAEMRELEITATAQGELANISKSTHIQAKTDIAHIFADKFILSSLAINSLSHDVEQLKFSHQLSWQDVTASLKHQGTEQTTFDFRLPISNLSQFAPIIEQFVPQLHVSEGEVSISATGELADSNDIDWRVDLEDATLVYQNYLFKHANTQASGRWDSSELHFPATNFSVSQIRAGPVVNNVTGQWGITDEFEVYLQDVQGDIFDGQVSADKLFVTGLDKARPSTLVTMTGVDVAQLIELEAQQGISVSGVIGASLPMTLTQQGVSIQGGRLYNESQGKLSIDNNVAFNAVKAQQQELGPILSLLENLDIHDINADVDLKTDGWLDVNMRLKGENPTENQAVNFNYNHQENIYTLFRALRLSDEITKKVEQEYQAKE